MSKEYPTSILKYPSFEDMRSAIELLRMVKLELETQRKE